ncbi:hypothetical protein [Citrobacter koseri]|uniref:hypothetical protein n=1 Tax=Citrobacter koseri TaxID=545 RepID=UPI0022AD15C1|nr:hypothetical protein [Citrobacter koseri]
MNTQLVTIVGLVAIPFSTALGFCAILLGLFSFDEKRKNKIATKINNILPNKNKATVFSQWWTKKFFLIFGYNYLSKRQLLSIPFFTILYSSLLFVLWFSWILIFKNPEHIIPKHIPTSISLELHDFITNGFFYSLLLDFISIFITRWYIKYSLKNKFNSLKSIGLFISSIFIILILFTLVIYHLKINSIENLYMDHQLYFEARPDIKWEPITILGSSLNIDHNETMIIKTSKGWLSSYFIPQALMLYTSIITQLSLIIIFMCYATSALLLRTKTLSLSLLKNAGTPQMSAWGFIILAALLILTIFISLLFIAAFLPTT